MARISQYDQDGTLNKLDKVLGTDSTTGATKNYSIESMIGLVNSDDLVDVFDGVSYAFKDYAAGSTTPKGIINLNAGAASNAAFSAINQIYISVLDKQGNSIANYLDDTLNGQIRIVQKSNIDVYGVFEVTAITNHDSAAYKKLTVTPKINNGNITVNGEYFISNFSAVFDQDFSDDSVTEFGDVTNAGSGQIITSAERTSLNNFTANGLLHADVVNTVTSTATNVPLSAAQGKVLKDLIDTINALLTSDNTDLDSLQEVVDFIEANKSTLDSLSISNIAGLQAALDAKQATETGKGLSANDFTAALLTKLNGIAAQAEVNVNANWNETNSNSDAFIQNKPTDLTTLSAHGVTELSDITSAGSGSIISSAERTKLTGIETSADVTDTTNVTAAGALMDSEVTNLSQVKAFDTTDYATAAQGAKADSAQQPPSEGAFVDGDKTKLDNTISSTGSGVANKIVIWSGASTLTQDTNLHWDTSNDRLGIGTTSPSHILTLESASSPALKIKDTTQGTTLLAFSQDANSHIGTFSNHPLVFDTNSAERMRINSSGDVGIGTDSPQAKLDVVVSDVSVSPNGNSSAVFRRNGDNYISLLSSTAGEGGVLFGNSGDAADGWLAYKNGSGNQYITIGTANSEKMRIDSAGKVGIGHSVLYHKFSVNGNIDIRGGNGSFLTFNNGDAKIIANNNGAGRDLSFETYNGSSSAERMRITAGGEVGIGTTSPDAKLDIQGDGADFFLQSADFKIARIQPRGTGANLDKGLFSLFDGSAENVRIDTEGNSWLNGGNVGIGHTSPTAPLDVRRSDASGRVAEFHNNVGYGINIDVESDGGVNTIGTATNQALAFVTNGGSNERMRIDVAGNVGIGTSSPTSVGGGAKLTVLQGADGNIVFARGGSTRQVQLGTTSTTGYINADNASGGLTFNVNTTERMRLNTSGNLGIGTSSPSEKLTVSGNGNFTGKLAVGSTASHSTYEFYNQDRAYFNGAVIVDDTFTQTGGGASTFSGNISVSGTSFLDGLVTIDHNLNIQASGVLKMSGTEVISAARHISATTGSFSGNISTSGVVLFNDNQGINFGNSNAKIYGSSADGIKFNGSGSEKMRLTQAGNLGIGTTSPTSKLSIEGNITSSGHRSIKHSDVAQDIVVKVVTKTVAHPEYGNGSSSGYTIDAIEGAYLEFTPGNTYKFDQSDSSNANHPLRFYEDAAKTTAYTTGVTTSGTPGSSGAYTQIIPTTSTPPVLFYQCSAHALMGSYVKFGTGTVGDTYSIDVTQDGNNVDLKLDAASGADSTVQLTAGSNITLTRNDAQQVTIAASGGGVTIQEEGSSLSTAATTLNFTGSAVTASGNGAVKTINVTGSGSSGSTVTIEKNVYTGDGSDLTFDTTTAIVNENNVQVYIDGVYQSKDTYTTSGSTVTFGSGNAPANGTSVELIHMVSVDAVIARDSFTGNGSTTAYVLSKGISNENATQVYLDGVYQSKNNYSTSGSTLTFSTAPPNGTAIEVVHIKASVDSSTQWQSSIKTADFTASAGEGYFVNTTSGGVTVTLPSSPALGDTVTISDYGGSSATNNIVFTSSNNIQGASANKILNKNNSSVELVYSDSTKGWVTASDSNDALSAIPLTVHYLVVAGGGGTSTDSPGGGGAGGLRTSWAGGSGGGGASESPLSLSVATNYSVAVGGGGGAAANGTNSTFSTITSIGGGKGGGATAGSYPGSVGGSGGGGAGGSYGAAGGAGTANQGFAGGTSGAAGSGATYPGGGGGGASAVGASASNGGPGGNGGAGKSVSITGSAVTYAGGGGGTSASVQGSGGAGGGGAGGSGANNGTNNTGGGGGGTSASGGSGVVILRYPNAFTISGLSGTTTTSGTDKITTFTTGSGNIQFN